MSIGLGIIITFSLVALVVGPLLLLGVYLLADLFKVPFADRILAAMVPALSFQWFVGGVVNVVGGLALVALGIWATQHFTTLFHRLLEFAIVIPGGVWRAWRGVSILRSFRNTDGPAS